MGSLRKKKSKLPSRVGPSEPISGVVKVSTVAEIGQTIRTARLKLGLRQEQAAGMCNVSPKFLSELERGKETVHLGKALGVIRNLGLNLTLVPSLQLLQSDKGKGN